jgi:hypothetical protein
LTEETFSDPFSGSGQALQAAKQRAAFRMTNEERFRRGEGTPLGGISDSEQVGEPASAKFPISARMFRLVILNAVKDHSKLAEEDFSDSSGRSGLQNYR